MPHPRIADLCFYPVQGIARILPLPVCRIVDVQSAGIVNLLAAPLGIVGLRGFRLLQSTALSPGSGAPFVLANISNKAFHTAMVNIQVIAAGKAHSFSVSVTPQVFQHIAG